MFRPRGLIPRAPGDRYALQILGVYKPQRLWQAMRNMKHCCMVHACAFGGIPPPDSVTVPAMKAAPAINNDLAFVTTLISLLVPSEPRIDFNLSPTSESHIHRSVDSARHWEMPAMQGPCCSLRGRTRSCCGRHTSAADLAGGSVSMRRRPKPRLEPLSCEQALSRRKTINRGHGSANLCGCPCHEKWPGP
jgi:hypothetical protein